MKHLLAVFLALFALPACAADLASRLDAIRLPPGFRIELWARVPGARSLVLAEELGAVLVASRGDAVHGVTIGPGGSAAGVFRVASGLKIPNGIAWGDGALYVAEQHRVVRLRGGDLAALAAASPETVFAGLPDKRWHGWRYAAFGPDGMLYVAVGAPCNVCRVEGLEGTIVRIDPRRGAAEVFARGIRNSVGMDFHPATGELHFTDNGADHMGDDSPPDELNRAPAAGLDFGFPYYGGGEDRTEAFAGEALPDPVTPPEVRFAAHVAALGIHFYRGSMLPPEYRHDAFVAQHGSWNRTVPDGYRVVRVRFDGRGRAVSHQVFAEGWLTADGAWGRPVDVAELPDGSLLVSDDRQGAIYRITYAGD